MPLVAVPLAPVPLTPVPLAAPPRVSSVSGRSSATATVLSTVGLSMGWMPRSSWDTQATGRSTIAASSGWDSPCRRRSWAILRPSTSWYSTEFTGLPPAGQWRAGSH